MGERDCVVTAGVSIALGGHGGVAVGKIGHEVASEGLCIGDDRAVDVSGVVFGGVGGG